MKGLTLKTVGEVTVTIELKLTVKQRLTNALISGGFNFLVQYHFHQPEKK